MSVKWTDEETRSLIEQIEAGKVLTKLSIPGRGKKSLMFKRRWLAKNGFIPKDALMKSCLRYRKQRKWKPKEDARLIEQVNRGLKFSQIRIRDRSKMAVSTRRKQLAVLGLCDFVGYNSRRPWTLKELRLLREYTIAQSLSAIKIFKRKLIPNRSLCAISKAMQRNDFIDSKYSEKAKRAIKISPERRQQIMSFLLSAEGYAMPAAQAAMRLQIKVTTLRGYRQRMGIHLQHRQAHLHLLDRIPA